MKKFRSKFEKAMSIKLKSKNKKIEYETLTLEYVKPKSFHKYHPDFIDYENKICYETKGIFDITDRKKMILVKEQHKDWQFVLIFQTPNKTISKTSKTTYADWCDKNGFEWVYGATL